MTKLVGLLFIPVLLLFVRVCSASSLYDLKLNIEGKKVYYLSFYQETLNQKDKKVDYKNKQIIKLVIEKKKDYYLYSLYNYKSQDSIYKKNELIFKAKFSDRFKLLKNNKGFKELDDWTFYPIFLYNFPEKKVKIGDTWKFTSFETSFANLFSGDIKLKEVKDNCAVLEVRYSRDFATISRYYMQGVALYYIDLNTGILTKAEITEKGRYEDKDTSEDIIINYKIDSICP